MPQSPARRPCAAALLAALSAFALLVSACGVAVPATPAQPGPTPTPSQTESAAPSPTVSHPPTLTPPAQPSTSPGGPFEYMVRSGDTLHRIAGRYDTSWQSLVYWNRDRYASLNPDDPAYDPNRIEIGWLLYIEPGVVLAYEPGPGATAQPTAEPTPTSPPSVAVRKGSPTGARVALTFDMGGRVDPALDIMDWLIANEAPATVFMTGAIIDNETTDAGRKVLALVDGHRALFELGNHSYTHRDFRTLGDDQIGVELRGMEEAVATRSSLDPRPLFRPPYGGYDTRVLAAVGANGYPYTILWDIDSLDWKPVSDGGPTADEIVAKVHAAARAGSIVVFHLGGYETLEALPGVLDALRDEGLQPVTVGDLLGL